MRWFKIMPMTIACIASLVIFFIAVREANYWGAVGMALIGIGSGTIVLEELTK